MQDFSKTLMQAYSRLKDIEKNPYPDPVIDSVTVTMLLEKTNQRARKAGCGHLVVRRDEYEQHGRGVDLGMRVVERMLAWCKERDAVPESQTSR